jgi:hypothetical protein
VGHVGRDLVPLVDEAPPGGGDVIVREPKEMLGGRGADQAVGLAQPPRPGLLTRKDRRSLLRSRTAHWSEIGDPLEGPA